ncbi:MAG: hypothetical protein A3H29_01005 [Acidobacteria bacterium RIFCSPLOWO2_02_FULL_67_21]|nr:MAG: hypothetical protein A3H29_01005 [Acidobacteria bacterium RIFCSPLOWO2_02_FULL_67_21]
MNTEEKELLSALKALAREEQGLAARPHVEARLMRAWDDARGTGAGRRPSFLVPVLKIAAAMVVAASAAYWWGGGGAVPPAGPEPGVGPAVMTSWPSSETLAWLDPEPESLQIVHVRVASAALAAQGYALSDPDGDGLVDLEVIVATDGTARGVRVVPASAPIY